MHTHTRLEIKFSVTTELEQQAAKGRKGAEIGLTSDAKLEAWTTPPGPCRTVWRRRGWGVGREGAGQGANKLLAAHYLAATSHDEPTHAT